MSVPSMRIEPSSGLRRPIRALRKTDLPVPDGPSITETSPAGIDSETPPQMSCLPNDLLRLSTLISTPMSALVLPRRCTHPFPVGRARTSLPRLPLPIPTLDGRRSYARVSFPVVAALHLRR